MKSPRPVKLWEITSIWYTHPNRCGCCCSGVRFSVLRSVGMAASHCVNLSVAVTTQTMLSMTLKNISDENVSLHQGAAIFFEFL